jgi:hypothetical protein
MGWLTIDAIGKVQPACRLVRHAGSCGIRQKRREISELFITAGYPAAQADDFFVPQK